LAAKNVISSAISSGKRVAQWICWWARLAKGRPARPYLEVGDAVDSWKVIIVEPEKQLALLFGMKAPGLGRLCFTLKDKGDHRELDVRAWWHPHGCRVCSTGCS
jgi:hypothetical protein